ncbi:zinc carboxypeptidase-like [Leptidea sinapis]|uniref:zinc carboxypeptidase-like n=1 Tax=Leptidea sinapis TaxID=189913 RepID=UPI00213677CE|nr:zinc carboxypeptidase-like [Leptidea sinapis]
MPLLGYFNSNRFLLQALLNQLLIILQVVCSYIIQYSTVRLFTNIKMTYDLLNNYKFLKISFTILCLTHICIAVKTYESYKVYSVIPVNEVHLQILTDLRKEGFEFWTDIVTKEKDVRIMVSPAQDYEFLDYMKNVGLNPVLSIPNVQSLINDQLNPATNIDRSSSLGSFSWDKYQNLDQIHSWLDELETSYPGIVSTVTIGNSNENRPIKGVIIDFKSGERGESPVIGMIEGGIHAREWISPATVTWIIKEFITSDNPDVRFMAEAFVWHIFPVVNPDGYVYTFTDDRMWRKNRNYLYTTNCSSDNDLSNGIDLNRNFDYQWMTVGASSNPCDQTFAGPSPASEPETQAISAHVERLKQAGDLIYYIAFHSYSQMILIPYSHLGGVDVLQVENYGDLFEIATRGLDKLTEKHNTAYTTGTSLDILYAVTGSSFDWVKGLANVPIVYLFELRDVGQYGFLLPTDQIIPNNEEIMACLLEMDKTTRVLGYYSSGSGLSIAFGLIFSIVLLVVVL